MCKDIISRYLGQGDEARRRRILKLIQKRMTIRDFLSNIAIL